ncbi:MAG TPA: hypothetical protein VFP10_02525 [Candidatus Eisenbacteria bacterium]|nr:hypothetical protein [Candidatus Eisenbacteria bacterium]
MTRWILLGIGDQDVDVLSKLSTRASPSEVLVYHPDPDALVLRLAELAELTVCDRLPEPEPHDVLVISSHAGTDRLQEAWYRVGARVLHSSAVGAPESEVSEVVAVAAVTVAAEQRVEEQIEASERMLHVANGPDITSMRESKPMQERSSETEDREVATMESGFDRERGWDAPQHGPADIWTDPATTFHYLMEQAGVRDYVLWWDGESDSWVPVLWSGVAKDSMTSSSRPDGIEVSHRWGRFILSGADEARLHRPALARVAEDIALRDLEEWRRSGERLRSRIPAEEHTDLPAWGRWLDEALPILSAEAALLWLRQDGAWRLARAWGEGVGLAGELRLPEPLFTATFGPGSAWRSWQPVPAYRVLFTLREGDHTWPLRQARLQNLMSGSRAR